MHRLSRSLQEKTAKYKKQLSDCCDLSKGKHVVLLDPSMPAWSKQAYRFYSNQSAAEKMRMEDEIKRYHDSCTEAAARSRAAELSILENMRRQSLYCLQKSLSDSREILLKLDEVALR
ncbi:hypothetical protein N1851_010875 [Merluccius polli]|uniref:TTC3/DZIP3-like helical domain-containing protein n=1 Tax=Merluccius polli TaxID=89951 RepID=A0AA47MY24_MERPO|nr:hypothetical protein N1851_010875 [Merluccius polli]